MNKLLCFIVLPRIIVYFRKRHETYNGILYKYEYVTNNATGDAFAFA